MEKTMLDAVNWFISEEEFNDVFLLDQFIDLMREDPSIDIDEMIRYECGESFEERHFPKIKNMLELIDIKNIRIDCLTDVHTISFTPTSNKLITDIIVSSDFDGEKYIIILYKDLNN